VRELLDLSLRWLHVIAAIMWIGNSLLFNWLDRNLKPADPARPRSGGAAWLLHSGGFYFVEKTFALDGGVGVRSVHWFKWQAYTTWLSGAALLAVVYYASARSLLVATAPPFAAWLRPELWAWLGIGISVLTLVGGWLIYDLLCALLLKRAPRITALLCVLLLCLLSWALLQVFTGRAAFLHVGALLATLMAGNVGHHIMPAQRAFIAAIEQGVTPGDELPQRAKLRSIHNNYITFPVVALMLSSHFPALYGGGDAWLGIVALVLGGAAIRHILNVRYDMPQWRPALAATMLALFASLYLLTRPESIASSTDAAGPVSDERAFAIVQKRCTVCHSTSPAEPAFGSPPLGVAFDTPEQVRALAGRIRFRAAESRTMPPSNHTHITDDERAALGRWALQQSRR